MRAVRCWLLLSALFSVAAFAEEPPAAPPPAPSPEPAPTTTPAPNLTQFQLPFPEEQGGGIASGSAGQLDFESEKTAVLSGGVVLNYKDIVVKAERIAVDLVTRVITASGGVTIDQGPQRLSGATAIYDLETKTGTITEAEASLSPDIYFSGTSLAKTGDLSFVIEDGTLTSCPGENPDWSFRLKRAEVEVEGYAHIHGASMRVKKLPVFYIPYIVWPAKRERASGFLVPQPGYSNRRGLSVSIAYFKELGRSFDTTFYADLYSKEYFGLGGELRYRPSEGTEGIFEGYAIRDPTASGELDEYRWKLRFDHSTTDLPWGMRGVVSFRDYSDFDYLFDFEREYDRNTLRSIVSKGFASGNWGPQSLNILIDDRQTLISDSTGQTDVTNTITQSRLPEVEYRLRSTQLGRLPLYLTVDSSLAYLDVDRGGSYNGSYGRIDVAPEIEASLFSLPWMSASVAAGYRYTWYGDSICRRGATDPATGLPAADACDENGVAFEGESFTRDVPTGAARLVGPSFSRIFTKKIGSFGKFKHVIEPRFTYSYVGDVDAVTIGRTPNFDEVDGVSFDNTGRVAIVNRVLAKPVDEKEGSAREIFSLEIARSYSFDGETFLQRIGEEQTTAGPIDTRLRFEPSRQTSLQAEVSYNTLASQMTRRSLSGSVGLGQSNLGLTWFTTFNAQTGETTSDQARVWSTFNLLNQRLRLEAQVSYDIEQAELKQQSYALAYNSECFAYRIEAREFTRTDRRDRDYRFLLSLKNVGTFLDLNSRQSATGNF